MFDGKSGLCAELRLNVWHFRSSLLQKSAIHSSKLKGSISLHENFHTSSLHLCSEWSCDPSVSFTSCPQICNSKLYPIPLDYFNVSVNTSNYGLSSCPIPVISQLTISKHPELWVILLSNTRISQLTISQHPELWVVFLFNTRDQPAVLPEALLSAMSRSPPVEVVVMMVWWCALQMVMVV